MDFDWDSSIAELQGNCEKHGPTCGINVLYCAHRLRSCYSTCNYYFPMRMNSFMIFDWQICWAGLQYSCRQASPQASCFDLGPPSPFRLMVAERKRAGATVCDVLSMFCALAAGLCAANDFSQFEHEHSPTTNMMLVTILETVAGPRMLRQTMPTESWQLAFVGLFTMWTMSNGNVLDEYDGGNCKLRNISYMRCFCQGFGHRNCAIAPVVWFTIVTDEIAMIWVFLKY